MTGKGVFQLHRAAIEMKIQIAGNIAVAQSIVLPVDFSDVLYKLLLNIREQHIEVAGAIKIKPECYFLSEHHNPFHHP